MQFVDALKKELKENKREIRVKAPLSSISGANWGELNVTSLSGSPIMLGFSADNLKIRFQALASGSICVPYDYRLDNHSNKPLHLHTSGSEFLVNFSTFRDVLNGILGDNYKLLEENENDKY